MVICFWRIPRVGKVASDPTQLSEEDFLSSSTGAHFRNDSGSFLNDFMC